MSDFPAPVIDWRTLPPVDMIPRRSDKKTERPLRPGMKIPGTPVLDELELDGCCKYIRGLQDQLIQAVVDGRAEARRVLDQDQYTVCQSASELPQLRALGLHRVWPAAHTQVTLHVRCGCLLKPVMLLCWMLVFADGQSQSIESLTMLEAL